MERQHASDEFADRRERLLGPVDVRMLPGAGHAPHVDCPEDTLAAIEEFVTRVLALHEGLAPTA